MTLRFSVHFKMRRAYFLLTYARINLINMSQEKQNNAYDFAIAPGIWGKKEVFVNFYMVQNLNTKAWFLIDAGLPWSADNIKTMARELFGEGSRPQAIILTHGHFDHTGALETLVNEWSVPVYAHALEFPYLTGRSSYPPADPTVGGGLMASMSWIYPKGPINVKNFVHALPDDNSIPGLEEWKYIHTPGHSPGHISLYREHDKVLIAGDAIVTTKPESALYALSYMKALSGPPKYLTCNWASAKISVLKLAALDPEVIATGHGEPMKGLKMRDALYKLSNKFDALAVPHHGRYVDEPAITDETGVVYLPPPKKLLPGILKTLGISAAVLTLGYLIFDLSREDSSVKNVVRNSFNKIKRSPNAFRASNRKSLSIVG
jgi:glyoxylase-like metal-dependent hydrolase (beta-lactamase superfamily II)